MGRQVGLTTPSDNGISIKLLPTFACENIVTNLQRNIGAIDTDLFVDNPAHRELPRSRYSIKA